MVTELCFVCRGGRDQGWEVGTCKDHGDGNGNVRTKESLRDDDGYNAFECIGAGRPRMETLLLSPQGELPLVQQPGHVPGNREEDQW